MRLRRSARVILFDPAGDVLLLRFVAEREDGPFEFWVTPGGEIEPGEEPRAAASRELLEELGIRVPLSEWMHEDTGGTYTHLGETVRNYDYYFVAGCGREEPQLAGVTSDEIRLMQEMRWWSLEELRRTEERVFPAELVEIAERAKEVLQG